MRKGPLADLFRATEAGRREADSADEADEQTLEVVPPVDDPPDDPVPEADAVEADRASATDETERAAGDAGSDERVPSLSAVDEEAEAVASRVPEAEVAPVQPAVEMARPRLEPSLQRAPRADASTYAAVIRVVGVGGAGLNAVDRMIDAGISQVEFVAVNTDVQQLRESEAPVKLHIGRDLTQGLGSGADPALGRAAAQECHDQLKHLLRGSDMVF
ncbi:MAG: hypothetical protein ACE5EV_06800, partial [Gaiellales bacterium]